MMAMQTSTETDVKLTTFARQIPDLLTLPYVLTLQIKVVILLTFESYAGHVHMQPASLGENGDDACSLHDVFCMFYIFAVF